MRRVKDLNKFISRAPKKGPRVLVADIETLPIEGYVWSLFKPNIGVDQIKEPSRLMSFAGKWLEDPAYFYVDNRDRDNPRDDFNSVVCAHKILSETDYVLAHNGKKFDLRKLRAFMAMHKLPPLPPVTVIDTLLANATAFGFDSQRLAFVSKYFSSHEKDKHSKFPGFDLWLGCLANNPEAWKANEKYNVGDVLSTEEMYLELRGWYTGVPNFGVFFENEGKEEHRCPNCGSTHVWKSKLRRTQVGVYQQYHCQDCGAYSRGRTMVRSMAERAHILTN